MVKQGSVLADRGVMQQLSTALLDVAQELTPEDLAQLTADPGRLRAAMRGWLATMARSAMPPEISIGSGLGVLLPSPEGQRRLAQYATPVALADWAGPVAGAGELERRFGLRRSTLHDWQRRGAVIGLLQGVRKHVYPLAQFIDGRPTAGMVDIVHRIGMPRVAWQWLIAPKLSLDGTPLDRLKAGDVAAVIAAAERDFG